MAKSESWPTGVGEQIDVTEWPGKRKVPKIRTLIRLSSLPVEKNYMDISARNCEQLPDGWWGVGHLLFDQGVEGGQYVAAVRPEHLKEDYPFVEHIDRPIR